MLPREGFPKSPVPCKEVPLPLCHREELEVLSVNPRSFMVYLSGWGSKACASCISRFLFYLSFFFTSMCTWSWYFRKWHFRHYAPSHFRTSIGAATEIADLPGFYIRIIPTANSLFNVSKLNVSTRNNVRAHIKDGTCFKYDQFHLDADNSTCSLKLASLYHSFGIWNFADWICISDGVTLPTPKYNCSILEDMLLEENAEFMSSTFADWKALQEALVLVKVHISS